jgi:type IV pilus assembly protein PilE
MLRKQRGITLIELVTVAIVIGILVAIAIPSYRSYLIRSQRSDAKTALLALRAAQEKFYLQNNRYTDAITEDTDDGGLGLRPVSDNGLYTIDVDLGNEANPGSDQFYVASAIPVDNRGQEEDTKCLTLTLTDVGQRGASGPGGTDYCWR